jgi:hypothetical protein
LSNDDLTTQFDEEMLGIYQRALLEADYNATRFLHMLHQHGGLATARVLLHSPTVSDGYAALWNGGV